MGFKLAGHAQALGKILGLGATTSISGSWPSALRIALRITAVSSASTTLIHIVEGGTLSIFGITLLLVAVYLLAV